MNELKSAGREASGEQSEPELFPAFCLLSSVPHGTDQCFTLPRFSGRIVVLYGYVNYLLI